VYVIEITRVRKSVGRSYREGEKVSDIEGERDNQVSKGQSGWDRDREKERSEWARRSECER